MFQTFSGSSRRPRQVNLSGARRTGESASILAQREREKRQRERDILKATRHAQRIWRGKLSRDRTLQECRDEWDMTEEHAGSSAYSSQDEALSQLERLLLLSKLQGGSGYDIERIRRYMKRLQTSLHQENILCAGGPWPMAYLRLQKLVLDALSLTIKSKGLDGSQDLGFQLETIAFLEDQIPTQATARQLYQTMARVVHKTCSASTMNTTHMALVDRILTTSLTSISASSEETYQAFACEFLTLPDITKSPFRPTWLSSLADHVNYKFLARTLAPVVSGPYGNYVEMKSSRNRLNLLGCFIYFHRHAHQFKNAEAYSSHKDFVHVISALLSSIADDVTLDNLQIHDADEGTSEAVQKRKEPDSFAQEQIISLVNQESIGSLLWGATNATQMNSEAKQLANYALTLLRFFPRRGDEIRMWLYLGSTGSSSTEAANKIPAIKYFWQASRSCNVFSQISRDARSVIQLLRAQPGTTGKSPSLSTSVQDDWRIILVFLELYTFVLKMMDDEEFFSASAITGGGSSGSSWATYNALPLEDIQDLTVFLKNLGFTMYFRAKDIEGEPEPETGAVLSSYFRITSPDRDTAEAPPLASKSAETNAIAGLAGISLDYVKGLVTGLLRSIHQRDSRRKFLPKDHWLMTSLFDMTSFIPDVVAEEENRHRIQEEDEDDVDNADADDFEGGGSQQLVGTSRDRNIRYHERLQRQQRKLSRKRYLQTVAPRSEILQNMPFFIPFTTRVQIFREFVRRDQYKRRNGLVDSELWRINMMNTFDQAGNNNLARHTGTIRRGHEFEDAYEQFYALKDNLKEPIQITFMDQFGNPEAGIDGGGVTKEFLTSVTSQAFSPTPDDIDLFAENEQHLLYPNPAAMEEHKEMMKQGGIRPGTSEWRAFTNDLLQRYEFLGRIIGKCLYEGILVDINFAGFFLLKWALTGGTNSAPQESGYRANLNDLRDLDEELYKGLIQLKNYTGDVEDFSLNFTVSDTFCTDFSTGTTKTITTDLKPDGANIPVTNGNKLVYISYMARHRLSVQPHQQTMAFLRGLSSMVSPSWLSMFNQTELQTLIGGTSSSIDVADLRRNTHYGGVYQVGDDGLEHPTVQLFWSVLEDMSDTERRAVLKFVTSTPRAPLLGFASLNPGFTIRDSSADETRLPSTSTCVNLLKLPRYGSKEVLKEKLLYAVFSGAGFDLS